MITAPSTTLSQSQEQTPNLKSDNSKNHSAECKIWLMVFLKSNSFKTRDSAIKKAGLNAGFSILKVTMTALTLIKTTTITCMSVPIATGAVNPTRNVSTPNL